jgi:hypothetical protein
MTDPTYMKFLEKNQYKVDDENKTLVFAYRPGDYVMPFGKHTGKTVSEIIKVDPDYHQKLALVRDQKTGAQAYTDIVRKFSDFKLLQQ